MIVWDEPNGKRTSPSMAWTLPIWMRSSFWHPLWFPRRTVGIWRYGDMAIGRLADGTIAVVFATLGPEGVSVISMRPASRKERNLL